ncbi:RdgB/HAM1 family non-canonical purine NTP pyrophosphatase [Alicyclobacillus shizuokensis]|uniref:RdgB/HAM1 family non-canonical purine NTP pyrophosphatase n=1 Tax=Alicyclobacillus shizuokensis TaxID=392014 RepID=UPI0008349E83|nr:RdgB/HAM1 family non-canonical purine NTP pyrophosphatase [Alicyclobacillus shizuokensis]
METVFVATKNAHKVAEFERLLAPLGASVCGLPDGLDPAPETGTQLVSNAVEKAAYYAPYCRGWVLADDSGLCVDALDGRPGVMSARYAGVHGDDAANNAKLLRELAEIPDAQRTAEFVCALALWHHELCVGLTAVGRVRGIILREPHGANGFGYDPLFWVPELGRTFADMTVEEKNQYSHRRRAVDRLLELAAHIPMVS